MKSVCRLAIVDPNDTSRASLKHLLLGIVRSPDGDETRDTLEAFNLRDARVLPAVAGWERDLDSFYTGLLGFAPLTAVDVQPASVDATRVNAARAGVDVRVAEADLSREPAPPAASFVANVPPEVHAGIATSWREVAEPRVGLLSGFGPGDADYVAAAYAACGFTEDRRHLRHGWVVSEVSRHR